MTLLTCAVGQISNNKWTAWSKMATLITVLPFLVKIYREKIVSKVASSGTWTLTTLRAGQVLFHLSYRRQTLWYNFFSIYSFTTPILTNYCPDFEFKGNHLGYWPLRLPNGPLDVVLLNHSYEIFLTIYWPCPASSVVRVQVPLDATFDTIFSLFIFTRNVYQFSKLSNQSG